MQLIRRITFQVKESEDQRLFYFLNKLEKIDKMLGLPSILSLFHNKFNKFNNTRAQKLDSIYHMTLRLL